MLTSAWVKEEAITLAVSLFAQVCEHVSFLRLPCKKVGDLLGDDICECTVINTACLLHALSLSEFLFESFTSGLRSLKTLIKIDWMSYDRSEVKIQMFLPCICRKEDSASMNMEHGDLCLSSLKQLK